MGCFGKGCFILLCLFLFLLIAGAVGIYYGMKTSSAVIHAAAWAQNAHVLATEPSPVPQFETTEDNIQATVRKWKTFETASRENQTAEVALTADDLNNLIARNGRARGKVFVSMENNRMHVQTSVPLSAYVGREGYYLNGDIAVQSDGARSLDQPPLNNITVNGRPLPSDLLGWKYRSRPLGGYVAEFRQSNAINSFEIRDGKLILNARGR